MDRISIILKQEMAPGPHLPPHWGYFHNIQTCLLVYTADFRLAFTGLLVLWFVNDTQVQFELMHILSKYFFIFFHLHVIHAYFDQNFNQESC